MTFEYRGEGRFTIFGRVTGTRYSFPARGARVLVDRRDASALEIVQAMERVSVSAEAAEDSEKSTRGGTEAREARSDPGLGVQSDAGPRLAAEPRERTSGRDLT